MCGVGGVWNPDKIAHPPIGVHPSLLARGPDGNRVWNFENALLISTRLAIVAPEADLENLAESDNTVFCYNGEITNYREIALEEGYSAEVATSDTRVFHQLIRDYGAEAAAERVHGMWAFLFFDKVSGDLIVGRDPFGIKPLFWAISKDDSLAVASTPAAVANLADLPWHEDLRGVLSQFALNGPAFGMTLINGVSSVPPGIHSFCRSKKLTKQLASLEHSPLLDPATVGLLGVSEAGQDWQAFTDSLDTVLSEHIPTDQPFAIFLSGGIDSTYLARLCEGKPATAFHLKGMKEEGFARRVSARYGIPLIEIDFSFDGFRDSIRKSFELTGVAFPAAPIKRVVVEAMVSQGFRIALSSNGADEAFAGYPRMPTENPFGLVGDSAFNTVEQLAYIMRLGKLTLQGESLDTSDFVGKCLDFLAERFPDLPTHVAASLVELSTFVLFDLNPSTDLTSMELGLETRVPFLDKRIFSIGASLPPAKIRPEFWDRKGLMKRVLAMEFGDEFVRRPKVGFSIGGSNAAKIASEGAGALRAFDFAYSRNTTLGLSVGSFERDVVYLNRAAYAYSVLKDTQSN